MMPAADPGLAEDASSPRVESIGAASLLCLDERFWVESLSGAAGQSERIAATEEKKRGRNEETQQPAIYAINTQKSDQ